MEIAGSQGMIFNETSAWDHQFNNFVGGLREEL
jgi:hypothetical protein